MPTATKTRPVTFVSPCPNLRLTIRPARFERRDTNGGVISDPETGAAIQFEKGRYTTEDQEQIDFLRNHRLLNKVGGDPHNGFWIEGDSPDEPEPTTADQMSAIVRAARRNDPKGIDEVLRTEESTHKRPAILAAAREAKADLEDEKGEPEGGRTPKKD